MAFSDQVDIVISTKGNLDFLAKWHKYLHPYNIIIVQQGEPKPRLTAPKGYRCTVYTKTDMESKLGNLSWCISFDTASCVTFGFLMSKKRYVYTIDPDCGVAKDPAGNEVDPVAQHLTNLLSPATPYFFNTLYDPFTKGADFVRGYPFSLREGVPTGMSHGLWLNMPDYDLPTFLVKQRERNARYVDAVLTVPKGVMFPVSAWNLAFDRWIIGPAMYHGSTEASQPEGFCGDLWAGWCGKVVCDHLGYGCKTGLPYVSCNKQRSLSLVGARGFNLFWQEEVVPFFMNIQLSPTSCTPEDCVLELAEHVKVTLGPKDAYFVKLAEGMAAYVECWKALAAKK